LDTTLDLCVKGCISDIYKNDNPRYHDIHDGQGNEVLPSQPHQLIVAKAGQGPPDPHKEKSEKSDLGKKDEEADQGVNIG
jgi:hypothetical protein